MLTPIFLLSAVVGGTVLFFQVALTLIGLGGHDVDGDVPGDMDVDVGGDLDAGGHFDADGDVDLHGADAAHGDPTSAFGIISLRTLVAAFTFFGLGGLTAQSTNVSPPASLVIALVSGGAAMYIVYWMFRGLYRLRAEGTVDIRRSVGRHGTVYLRIPGHESGTGKIQLNLQNRTMEYLAMTSGEALPTGAKVVVVDVITPDTIAVLPVPEPERVEDV